MKRLSIMSILFPTFASVNKSVFIMKVKLTTEQIQKIAEDPVKASEAKKQAAKLAKKTKKSVSWENTIAVCVSKLRIL